MRSSTSSSERRRGFPWGGLWCVAFFLAAELVFRFLPTSFFLTFDQHDYDLDETADYSAMQLALDLLPAPEVAIIGTSRARESIQSPVLAERLSAELHRDVTVRNYGVSGGRVDVCLAVLDRLIAQRKLPALVIVALDASDFRDEEPSIDRYRAIDLATLPADIRRNGWPTETDMMLVLGNSVPLRLALARPTLRYRVVSRGDWNESQALAGNAAFGGTSGWGRALVQRPLKRSPRREKRTLKSYVVRSHRLERLEELVEEATAQGVRVVLAELPVSPPLRVVPGVVQAQEVLRERLAALKGRPGVWVVSSAGLDGFGKRQFRDASHMNAKGASRYVSVLVPTVVESMRPPARAEW